jgi:hypothetical protein
MMKRSLVLLSMVAVFAFVGANAQSPTPATVQLVASDTDSLPAAIKLLRELKTANEEMLKKQEAALQQLEELQKAADEVKIFSKRS